MDKIPIPNFYSKESVLEARAKELAKPDQNISQEASIDLVEFQLAHERYGIESKYILEICPLKELTPLPFTPSFVMGIINVRGRIFSVIDVKIFFDLPHSGITDLNKVIIIHYNDMEIGILADRIISARSIPLASVEQPLTTLSGIQAEYLKGITAEPLIILDVKKMLTDKNRMLNLE
ncbi:MAG: chemotaxis protein CheW [Desulfamplus sp.]|nr:chemotaxis protein CheW [Desulfamplus sp.]